MQALAQTAHPPLGFIHPTALVDKRAELDSTVQVGPYTTIGPQVRIGAGTTIGAHCVLEGRTTIGDHNHIFQFNSLGAIPQDKKYQGEDCELVIGEGNTIREFCTVNIGSPGGGGITRVGNDNWIMAYVHLAHDCIVGNHTIFANNTQLAGHVQVEDWAVLGGFTLAHQFVRIGAHSMTALASVLVADLPPYVMCQGQPARARSMNFEGLKRRGYTTAQREVVKALYKIIYRSQWPLSQAIAYIQALVPQYPDMANELAHMATFLQTTNPQRGIVR